MLSRFNSSDSLLGAVVNKQSIVRATRCGKKPNCVEDWTWTKEQRSKADKFVGMSVSPSVGQSSQTYLVLWM